MRSQAVSSLWSPVPASPLRWWPCASFCIWRALPGTPGVLGLGDFIPQGHLAISGDIFIGTAGMWVPLSSSGWRSGMLLNSVVHGLAPHPLTKTYPGPNVSRPVLKNPKTTHIRPFPSFLPHIKATTLYWMPPSFVLALPISHKDLLHFYFSSCILFHFKNLLIQAPYLLSVDCFLLLLLKTAAVEDPSAHVGVYP